MVTNSIMPWYHANHVRTGLQGLGLDNILVLLSTGSQPSRATSYIELKGSELLLKLVLYIINSALLNSNNWKIENIPDQI